ncbi:hypothetical protein [Cohnella sp.]|uniref:hypothetical protein n=1 Tax=Cohnella sp. TaxID=1883426 RepID=UPI003562C5AE
MKKNNKTAMVMSVAVLTLVLMGTACSNNNTDSSPSASPSLSASPSMSAAPETEGTAPVVHEGTGIYVGQGDTHSIEIKTEAGPTAFQIPPEIGDKVSSWESGTAVKYQFTEEIVDSGGEKIKQPTIITIDKQ